jgi:hypothetical protein
MCKRLLFLISFVAVLGLVGSAFAKEMHVYGYNPSAKYQTIEAAYAAANAGDTITVHGDPANFGLYKYNWDAATYKNNDSKFDVTFRAYMSNYSDPTTRDNVRLNSEIDFAYKTGWTWDGFNITGGDYGFYISQRNFRVTGLTIKNCIFANTTNKLVYTNSGTSYTYGSWNVTIENCTLLNGLSDGLRGMRYNYGWTVKDTIFQSIKHWDNSVTGWSGYAMSCNNGGPVYADYCSFFDNAKDADGTENGYSSSDQALEGVGTVHLPAYFQSLDPNNPRYLWLAPLTSDSIVTGASDSGYIGARPTPEPATIALLGLGGLALLRRKR